MSKWLVALVEQTLIVGIHNLICGMQKGLETYCYTRSYLTTWQVYGRAAVGRAGECGHERCHKESS